MGHGSGGSNVVPTMITQSVSGDSHAASLTGSDTHAASLTGANSDSVSSSVSGQTLDPSASTVSPTTVLGDQTGNTSENVMFTAAGITPASAVNQMFIAVTGVIHKITNTGTVTTRIRRTNVAGAILATQTTGSLVANTSERIKTSAFLTNEAASSQVYCVTTQASTAGMIEFGLGLSAGCAVLTTSDTHAASLTGTDTHAAALTGSSGSCV